MPKVGSTWLGPVQVISQHFRRVATQENGPGVTNVGQQRFRVIDGKLKVLRGNAVDEGHPKGQAEDLNQCPPGSKRRFDSGSPGSGRKRRLYAASTASSRAGSGLTKMA